jgi:hypothetical protein
MFRRSRRGERSRKSEPIKIKTLTIKGCARLAKIQN